ncbi:septum formation protein [Austwickia chelonae]|uniref:Nucleoside triphosphate pyrophosphatase n=1 Tax=Austwickia chelonae NBRC 105200 TaxID=1184607 RepID=K6VJ58_9MICO|nr:Maf-like protein [Austwickia chelonae NBRC 105200]SEW30435.1 septum formation protein [Austwickia chelonae]
MTLVLASASPARAATLRAAGVTARVVVSAVDEDAVLARAEEVHGSLEPADAALVLARAKCEEVAARLDVEGGDVDLVVLGCDSLFEVDGRAYGKPVSAEDAVARWRAMSGNTGQLHTGHWLIDLRDEEAGGTGATLGCTVTTEVSFARVGDAEIEAYVATGEPLACAGAFTVDGLGGAFVTGVRGDHHNVVGLSLPELRVLLAEIGIPWPALWSSTQTADVLPG